MSDEVVNTIDTIHSETPYAHRDEAIAALNAFTGHRIGQIISLLYRGEAEENNVGDVEILMAVGIKDAYKCGVSGDYPADPGDAWENKWYPGPPHGPEFWRLMFDSGQSQSGDDSHGGSGNPLELLGTTHIKLSGEEFDVLNPDGEDRVVEDTFTFNNLNRDDEEENED